jgi:MFS family permease
LTSGQINLWAFSFLIGPYLSPFISGFIVEKLSWRNDFAVLCGFYGLSVLLILLFGDETLYNRDGFQKARSQGVKGRISRLLGIEGITAEGRPSIFAVTKDLFSLLLRPYLVLPSSSTLPLISPSF